MDNPWYVDSIEAFACLKCPECVFNTKENRVFQNHAVEKHPLSHVLFGAPKTGNNASIVVLNYDPIDIEKYIEGNANMLQYSIVNSSEVSLIKEELSEKTYFVEQVISEPSESNESNFDDQPLSEMLESNIENQTVVHMTNIDKETMFEENTALAPKKEDFENNLTDKTQCETLSEIAHKKEQLVTDLLHDQNEVDENIASFDEKSKKFSCSKCDTTFAKEGFVKYHFAKAHQQKGKKRLRCKYCTSPILSQADLELHILSVHGGKEPECTVCNEIFHKESDLIIHLKEVHDKKISYSCHICGFKCARKHYLRQHNETVHEKKKPFKCKLCDYR
jgi:DNA-directed RNA polymerase subunit RPC12/RpoP